MATDLKAIKVNKEKIHCGFTLDQIDEINWKILFALSTFDILKSIDMDEVLNIESLSILTQEAYNRLKEARDILNSEVKEA